MIKVKTDEVFSTPLTEEEELRSKLDKDIAEAQSFLNDSQWVESYIIRHEQGLITIPYESNKWVLHAMRLEAIALLKENGL